MRIDESSVGARDTSSVEVTIAGPLRRADLPGLLERVGAVLDEARVQTIVCTLTDVAADAVAVDALARMALAARRSGCALIVPGLGEELRSLVDLAGLAEVLGSG
jgi:ABC-type transporter Mla MlaB component